MSSSTIPGGIDVRLRQKLLLWLPTLAWLCLLATFSTDTFSSEHTGTILWKIVHAIYRGISATQFEVLHHLIRKTAHFTFYGLLSVFAFYSWKTTLPAQRDWTLRWSALAVALTLVAGSLDEFHQTFLPSRTASPRDALLDAGGAVFFQLLLALLIARKNAGRSRAGSPASV